ncbi:acyl-CoA dehydratase activase [Methanocaldococcus infernus]|uniref:CoA-substrate-specific enzyme activase n=1 Tax=Methanocaldococcus infernus (strain DSM 11812 / JCM 15783 / ME) TaxID=573063 RepID=D5VS39_METIM|nr:acyl-CoA dehydratase activase [Methanocaldococcus infernus]ADG13392.1 CoA-substrate-specific enzyme activase [Methanocaldococcus infernus ME]
MILGVDVGSTTTKMVVMDNNKIVDYKIENFGVSLNEEELLKEVNKFKAKYNVKKVVATGYGRHKVEFADKVVPEVIALGRGANYFFKEADGVIDIGGQDSKVIKIDKDGSVKDFILSDKCAAGTGKFLEKVLEILKIDIDNINKYKSKNVAKISSMCAVFAESEIISLLAKNVPKEEILMGVYESICNRIVPMVKKLKINNIVFSGGVAKNKVLAELLEEKLDRHLLIPEEPQIVCCVGAILEAKKGIR